MDKLRLRRARSDRFVLPFGPIHLGPDVWRGVLGRTASLVWERGTGLGIAELSSLFRPPCRVVLFFRDCEACHILVGREGRLKFNKHSVPRALSALSPSTSQQSCVVVSLVWWKS